jgi:tetratricopeptide (TPR) repeat protein
MSMDLHDTLGPNSAAAIWNVPYPRNANFTGRDKILTDLRHALTEQSSAHRVQVISGLGGVGKTQLAAEYAYKHRWDYTIIWWISADDSATLALTYAKLARRLGMNFPAETGLEDIRHVLRRVLAERSDWLLIFDNASGPEEIRNYLPLARSGNVLITSRNPNFGTIGRSLTLPPFSRKESIAFLHKRTGRNDADDVASKLAAALGDLPLAMEQAAAVIEQSRISFSAYLARFETHWAELLRQGRRSTEYPDSVAMTWELSFRQVEQESLAAADLLNFCSFLAPEQITRAFLAASGPFLPRPLAETVSDVLKLDEAIAELRRFSLIEANEQSIWIHRLVSTLSRDRLTEITRKEWAGIAVKRMSAAFDFQSQDPATWSECAELLPHALAAAEHGEHAGVELTGAAGLLDSAGRYLNRTAQFAQARELFVRALALYERVCGPAHPKVSAAANNLGRVLTRLGDHRAAAGHFERALAIDQATYGNTDPHVATVVNNYGMALHAGGDAVNARQQFEWALGIYENHYGTEHPKTATVLNNLGYVTHQLGDAQAAGAYLERALASTEATFGSSHPMVASILCNLGGVKRSLLDFAGARENLNRALTIDQATYGATHPDVARDLEALAGLHESQGELAAARDCMERALAIDESVFGADHPMLLRRLLNLARVLQKIGDPGAARMHQERAAVIKSQRQTATETLAV